MAQGRLGTTTLSFRVFTFVGCKAFNNLFLWPESVPKYFACENKKMSRIVHLPSPCPLLALSLRKYTLPNLVVKIQTQGKWGSGEVKEGKEGDKW